MLCSWPQDDFFFFFFLSMISSDHYEIDEEKTDEFEYTIDLNCTQYIDV